MSKFAIKDVPIFSIIRLDDGRVGLLTGGPATDSQKAANSGFRVAITASRGVMLPPQREVEVVMYTAEIAHKYFFEIFQEADRCL